MGWTFSECARRLKEPNANLIAFLAIEHGIRFIRATPKCNVVFECEFPRLKEVYEAYIGKLKRTMTPQEIG